MPDYDELEEANPMTPSKAAGERHARKMEELREKERERPPTEDEIRRVHEWDALQQEDALEMERVETHERKIDKRRRLKKLLVGKEIKGIYLGFDGRVHGSVDVICLRLRLDDDTNVYVTDPVSDVIVVEVAQRGQIEPDSF